MGGLGTMDISTIRLSPFGILTMGVPGDQSEVSHLPTSNELDVLMVLHVSGYITHASLHMPCLFSTT